jgi:putative transposase
MGKTVYPSQYKTRIVLEVLKEEKTLGKIASDNNINPNMVRNWRKEFLEKAPLMLEESKREQELGKKSEEMTVERAELMKTIGELTVERDWLKKNLQKYLGVNTKKSLVSDELGLTIERQCELLGLNRSTYYYREVA